jgi:hypothetical protein
MSSSDDAAALVAQKQWTYRRVITSRAIAAVIGCSFVRLRSPAHHTVIRYTPSSADTAPVEAELLRGRAGVHAVGALAMLLSFDYHYSEITLRSATSLQSYVLQTLPYGAYCKIVYSSQPSAAFTASSTFRTTLSTPSLFSRYTGTQPMRRYTSLIRWVMVGVSRSRRSSGVSSTLVRLS